MAITRHRLRFLFIAILLAAGAPSTGNGPATAQEEPAARIVTANLSPSSATVGDRLTLTIDVAHPLETTATGPGFGDDFGGLEIVDIPQPSTAADGNEQRTTLEYVLASFRTGTVTVPPLEVTYRGSGGSGSLTTPSRSVTIESVLPPDGDDTLRPLKPQLDIPTGAPPPIVPALYVGIFAALTAFAYVLIRRAADARPVPPPVVEPPRGPHDVARARLDELAAAGIAATNPDLYYATIAATVRRYLSDRFGFPAYAMTRRELQRDMTRAGIDRWPARVTSNLLEQCDAVEFAGFRPPAERAAADLTAAYEIIDLTAPQTAAPEAPAQPSEPAQNG